MRGALPAVWEIPEPLSVHPVQVDDDNVIILRRHGNPEGPRLILSHGNGLAIDLYYPFWSLLSRDFDLIVHDLRNHGWNKVGTQKDHSVDTFARDHDRIFDAIASLFGVKPTVGVFHSISALAGLHTPSKGDNYSALVLFDPPLCNPGSMHREMESRARRTADMLRRRTQWFRSREELAALHTNLPYFQRAVPGIFELVARTTLKESESGQGFELRCPSEFEAQIWDHASAYAVSVDFGALRCPVKIVSSDPTSLDPNAPMFDYGDADIDHELLPETTHMLPLEKPQECEVALRRFLMGLGIL
ncbi:MAG: alpha/beta hydrolase [Chloroflexota bacterium]|nr:alpha/beta hydrolase [Chloroflexota bacterium]